MNTFLTTSGLGSSGDPKGMLPSGFKAGPWVVELELGRGGMGSVYAVNHEGIGKRAALKVIHQLLGPAHADRMIVEARVVNRVGHPNIVDIFDTGTLPDGRPYIVMERLDGRSLAQRVKLGKILPTEVIQILRPVAEALIAAHDAGVIHRDLKTDNVFLCDDPPHVKLLDWGIAKEISNDARRTVEGIVVGTPHYLSPEQARAGEVTTKSDVYSFGVVAYELFLEQLPFEADSAVEIMMQHLRSAPPRPSELWPDIPASLERLLLDMLAKEPDERPSMIEVARRLDEVAAEIELRKAAATIAPASSANLPAALRPGRSYMRAATPHELAATEFAGESRRFRVGSRRWQYAIGVAALMMSSVFFVITRESDSAADGDLPAKEPASLIAAPPPVMPAASIATPAIASANTADTVSQDTLVAPASSTELATSTAPVAEALLEPTPTHAAPPVARSLPSTPSTRIVREVRRYTGGAATTSRSVLHPLGPATGAPATALTNAMSFEAPKPSSPPPTPLAKKLRLDPDGTLDPYK
jgi:serine/threonine-protein kinase